MMCNYKNDVLLYQKSDNKRDVPQRRFVKSQERRFLKEKLSEKNGKVFLEFIFLG